jgi:hypothetical protein
MGTRSLTAVYDSKGELKVAQFGHFDGHIDHLGKIVYHFVKSVDQKYFEERLKICRFVKDAKEKERIMGPAQELGYYGKMYFNSLSGSRILYNILYAPEEEVFLENNIDFLEDTLFCEYGYIIDYQKNTLEIVMSGKSLHVYDLNDIPETVDDFVKELMPKVDHMKEKLDQKYR